MPYARAPSRSVTAATSDGARRASPGATIRDEAARHEGASYGTAALAAGTTRLAGAALRGHRRVRGPPIGRLPSMVAGNAPDWAELLLRPGLWARPAGGEYLVYHRGITHSFVGAAVEIVALTGVVTVLLRLWARRAGLPPPPWRWVAACVTATVASHLYLDWQGSYGLRPFLPWRDRKSVV